MPTHKITIADDAYTKTQEMLVALARIMLGKPLIPPTLDLFIERAETALAAGPEVDSTTLEQIVRLAKAAREFQTVCTDVAEQVDGRPGG